MLTTAHAEFDSHMGMWIVGHICARLALSQPSKKPWLSKTAHTSRAAANGW
ncbi:MAG: hypothetical protein CM15mP18_1780 [Methanobacteriota archaeon]|nr:MAG: hypothetical protein CM15mP18_1780 [Euryarchaeota archaeon]